jgi:hypothetical protein
MIFNRNQITENASRPSKIVSATIASGVAGYALSKGIEFMYPPIEPKALYEIAVSTGSMVIGSFVANETIDR